MSKIIDTGILKNKLREIEDRQKQKEKNQAIPTIIGICSVCKGEIKQILQTHLPKGPHFIGKQVVTYYVSGAYCTKCGLMYNHSVLGEK